jgi:hypothetical protein
MDSSVALQSRLKYARLMKNPSTTQLVELRQQIALADDARGVNRERIWALALFSRTT